MSDEATPAPEKLDFIREIIRDDLASGKHPHIVTRFPPEPNGYLHIGHAKAFCLNFSAPLEFPGASDASRCNLRMDDTNPAKEDNEYVEAIQEDVKWLGFDWNEHLYFASDYYEKLYNFAEELIEKGLAYVDSQSADEIKSTRGTATEPGKNSPFRDRSVEENLDLFRRMRGGEFEDGAHILRAKIDMASPNFNLRDPAMYRILRAHHHRTGNDWCIYPLYDFAHPLSDALEGITHSLCSLEFENHRPLYDWFVEHCSVTAVPRQIEFSRLSLTYTVTSKRKLLRLVEEKLVDGWDDPRMPTLSGLRRRGYTPGSILNFCKEIGMTKFQGTTDIALLEHAVRSDLNASAPRYAGVLDPIKITITDYPEDKVEMRTVALNPEDESAGTIEIPFTRELYIDAADFMEDAPKKFFRLKPDGEVRLRNAYIIKCEEIIKDADGKVIELKCSHDADTLGKNPEGRKVKGVVHWVPAAEAATAEVRLYDRLFKDESPEAGEGDFTEKLNPDSLEILSSCKIEPALAAAADAALSGGADLPTVQFVRVGYFALDKKLSKPGAPVFNRTVALRDSWKG